MTGVLLALDMGVGGVTLRDAWAEGPKQAFRNEDAFQPASPFSSIIPGRTEGVRNKGANPWNVNSPAASASAVLTRFSASTLEPPLDQVITLSTNLGRFQ